MTRYPGAVVLIGCSLISGGALAVDGAWKGEAEAGLLVTSGNTSTENVNLKGSLIHERNQWRNTTQVSALRAGDDSGTTAERFQISNKLDYSYNPDAYAFISVQYEDDRFSGYDYRASEIVGYGRRFAPSEQVKIALEGGPGARQSRPDGGDTEAELVVLFRGTLDWLIGTTATFTQELSSEIGEDVTISKSVSSLKTRVAGALAMKLSATVRHVSDVAPGVENTDTETSVTLVYSF